MRVKQLMVGLMCLCILSPVAGAAVFSFADGTRAGQVEFDVIGTDLVVTLTNTSTFNTTVPEELLTAVFFDLSGSPSLTPASAILNAGSVVQFGTTPLDGVVGGEWAYNESAAALAPGGGSYGIGTAGFGIFGPADMFPGADLNPPGAGVNGMDYGLLSEGNILGTGNPAVTGGFPLIDNSVIFSLSGLPQGFDVDTDISNVWFQYGTDLDQEPSFPGNGNGNGNGVIPEPLTVSALLLGIGGLTGYLKRRNRR